MNQVKLTLLACLAALSILALLVLVLYRNSAAATKLSRMSQRAALNDTKCHDKRLLVISFDGFRWNYLDRTETPNFDMFMNNGVQAKYGLMNAFVTTTLPNHFTLATGLWEENHNIVANHMYDPVLNETFDLDKNISQMLDSAWLDVGGEPIWVTNQLYGNHHSGVIMWFGGGAPIRNTVATKNMNFQDDFKNETKIETMISWFKEDCRMNLGMIYFPQPDEYGHKFGPESEAVTRMIGGLDEIVGFLLKRFEEENLLESTNIILTSDHGFASAPLAKLIDLDEIVDPQSYFPTSISPVAGIWPKPGYSEEIYANLTTAAAHFTVYQRENIPEHFHYKHSRRVPPIIVIADEFYSFKVHGFNYDLVGDHGYDNRLRDMHPFFLAMGPDFKSGFAVDSFDSVDMYPLMCHILGVDPSPNNGSMEIVSSLLKSPGAGQKNNIVKYLVLVGLVACLLVIVLGGIIFYVRFYIMNRPTDQEEPDAEEDEDSVIYTSDSARVPLL